MALVGEGSGWFVERLIFAAQNPQIIGSGSGNTEVI